MLCRFSRIARTLACLAAGVFVGCQADLAIEPLVNSVAITPRTMPHFHKGDTISLSAAVVGNDPATVVEWHSRDLNVALVTPNGLVTAQYIGSTWIVAVARGAFSSARDSVQVVVDSFMVALDAPMITVVDVRNHSTSLSVDPSAVSGVIDLVARHDLYPSLLGNATVKIELNGQEACRFPVATQQANEICTIDTAELTASGARKYPNGSQTARALVVRTDGVVIATAITRPLVISNP